MAGTSVLVMRVPTTWTATVLVTSPDLAVTVMIRLARLPPIVSVAVTRPVASVVVPLWDSTPSLSADSWTEAPATTTRVASTAVTVTVVLLEAVLGNCSELAVTIKSAAEGAGVPPPPAPPAPPTPPGLKLGVPASPPPPPQADIASENRLTQRIR